jgi:hypothetical protein
VLLADASSACASIGSIGFANPALYAIAAGPGASTAFNDITTGDNDFTGTHGGSYAAGPGYDLASGLGSPIAGSGTDSGLVSQLCSPVVENAVAGYSGVRKPVVNRITPTSAPGTNATTVTITGTRFYGAIAVQVGAVRLGPGEFDVVSGSKIVATVPPGNGRQHVLVTTSAGVSRARPTNILSFLTPPKVGKLMPDTGPSTGGERVIIIGSAFTAVESVTFGGVAAKRFEVRSPTRIVAIAPPGEGSVHLVVVTKAGRSVRSEENLYRYH